MRNQIFITEFNIRNYQIRMKWILINVDSGREILKSSNIIDYKNDIQKNVKSYKNIIQRGFPAF